MSHDTALTGLNGTSPLGYLAAIGAQAAYPSGDLPTLRFDGRTPVIGGPRLEHIVETVLESYTALMASPAANPTSDSMKLATREDTREYLTEAHNHSPLAYEFATAQVSEGPTVLSGSNKGRSKPGVLNFTAGNQSHVYMGIGRGIAAGTTPSGASTPVRKLGYIELRDALVEPGNGITMLRWGDADFRTRAHSATSPSKEQKKMKRLVNPALTALALLGMSKFPIWPDHTNRPVTKGITRRDDRLYEMRWLLWNEPTPSRTVGTFIGLAHSHLTVAMRRQLPQWGVTSIWSALIQPSLARPGYFVGRPRCVWQAT